MWSVRYIYLEVSIDNLKIGHIYPSIKSAPTMTEEEVV